MPRTPNVFLADSRDYSVDEVVRICLQDLPFYEESGGGVTLSGGEALVQHRFTTRLLRRLRDKGVHTAVETTGYAAPGVFEKMLREVDLPIIDAAIHDRRPAPAMDGCRQRPTPAELGDRWSQRADRYWCASP